MESEEPYELILQDADQSIFKPIDLLRWAQLRRSLRASDCASSLQPKAAIYAEVQPYYENIANNFPDEVAPQMAPSATMRLSVLYCGGPRL